MPSPGPIKLWHPPGGPGMRVDSHVYSGYSVPPNYDSMIGKLIAHGDTRETAIARMRNALAEMVVEGIKTNIALHQEILSAHGLPGRRPRHPLPGAAARPEVGPAAALPCPMPYLALSFDLQGADAEARGGRAASPRRAVGHLERCARRRRARTRARRGAAVAATRVQALFAAATAAAAVLIGAGRARSGSLPDASVPQRIADRVWEREWLQGFPRHALRAAAVDLPAARAGRRSRDAVVVRLDPGLAFGTGTHPSTALCLEWLDGATARRAQSRDRLRLRLGRARHRRRAARRARRCRPSTSIRRH